MKMIPTLLLVSGLAAPLFAQPVIAPGSEQVGNPRGDNRGDYNITSSFETGYRFFSVGGNESKYRSDVNYRNGLRLLGGSFAAYSRDGHGHYFDELLINVQGLGNDPYQNASFRIVKNGLYRYDMNWRQNDYYNPALYIARGQHFMDTSRRLQDHNFTLFPQSALKLFLGYSRNTQDGPALTTIQLFDSRGDEFPLFANIRREQNEYRLGGEVTLLGNRVNILRVWEHFKEDSAENGVALTTGNNATDLTTLTSFRRSQPYHGSTNSWRVNWINDSSKLFQINGRFAYAGGRRNFIFDENAIGTGGRAGAAALLQTYVLGSARRPVTAANLTFSLFPTDRLTIVNHSGFHNTRIDGNGLFTQINISNLSTTQSNFEFLGIRTFTNQTDVNYRAANWITVYTGYQFSNRLIRSVQSNTFFGVTDRAAGEQENTLHAGLFGVRLRPVKPLNINLDAEVGRADNPFYPISDKNYHALNGRVQYKARNWTFSAFGKTNYNTNSTSLTAFASRSRTYAADLSWAPKEWFSFDAGYNKLHLDTIGGIAYFLSGNLVNGTSRYISNIHAANLQTRFRITARIDLFAGYSRVQDTGDGRTAAAALVDAFSFNQTFPLTYDTPMSRLSVKISQKLRWNAGYQYYHYREDFQSLQNYRAHTGFTSLTWAF